MRRVQTESPDVRPGPVDRLFRGAAAGSHPPVQVPALQVARKAARRMDGGAGPVARGHRCRHAGAAPCKEAPSAGIQSGAAPRAPAGPGAPYPALIRQSFAGETYETAGGTDGGGEDTECGGR